MGKIRATLIVSLICIIVVNIPVDKFSITLADSGDAYPYQPTDDIILEALGYLKSRQAEDGSICGFSISGWVAMAISAAEQEPQDWDNLIEYFKEHTGRIDDNKATDWERQTLAIVALGENPRNFGGIDYVAKVESFFDEEQVGDPANLYDDFFGIFALVSGGIDKDSPIVQTVREYIKQKQNENGGWGDVDSTAAAVMALVVAGENSNSNCITDALSFIKATQTDSGGFQSWGTANAASTAWAVNAIVAAGGNPTSSEWKNDENCPIDFLLSLRQEDGCFNWSMDKNMNPEWMTSYVISALLGKTYPVKIYESNEEEVNEPDDSDEGDEGEIDDNSREEVNEPDADSGSESDLVKDKKVEIVKPENNTIYLMNRKINIKSMKILAFGHIDIKVKATDDVEKVAFYIDDELEYVDTERPFEWRWNGRAFFKGAIIRTKTYIYSEDFDIIRVRFKIQETLENITVLLKLHHEENIFSLIKQNLTNLEEVISRQIYTDQKEIAYFNIFPRFSQLIPRGV